MSAKKDTLAVPHMMFGSLLQPMQSVCYSLVFVKHHCISFTPCLLTALIPEQKICWSSRVSKKGSRRPRDIQDILDSLKAATTEAKIGYPAAVK